MTERVLPCEDCPVDCVEGDVNYFMVRNELWDAFGVLGENKLLCLPCFEKRMGRQLRLGDLNYISMNLGVVRARFPEQREVWESEMMVIVEARHQRVSERLAAAGIRRRRERKRGGE